MIYVKWYNKSGKYELKLDGTKKIKEVPKMKSQQQTYDVSMLEEMDIEQLIYEIENSKEFSVFELDEIDDEMNILIKIKKSDERY